MLSLYKQKILVIALIISCGLNLAVFGYIISNTMMPTDMNHDHVMRERMEGLMTLLPEGARTILRDDLVMQTRDVRHNLQAMHRQRQLIQKMIRQPNVTEEELNEAFAKLRAMHSDTQRIYQDAFSKAVANMTLEQRTATSTAIKKRHHITKKPVEKTK